MTDTSGALLLNWFDLADEDGPDFEDWHNREHAPERMSLPGFVRCRRYVSVDTTSARGFQRLIIYDAIAPDAFSTAEYRLRLDHPTVLTRRIVPKLRYVSRAIMTVETHLRTGLGTWLAVACFNALRPASSIEPVTATLGVLPAVTAVTYATASTGVADAKHASVEGTVTDSLERRVDACLLIEASALAGVTNAAETLRRRMSIPAADIRLFQLSFVLTAA